MHTGDVTAGRKSCKTEPNVATPKTFEHTIGEYYVMNGLKVSHATVDVVGCLVGVLYRVEHDPTVAKPTCSSAQAVYAKRPVEHSFEDLYKVTQSGCLRAL